MILVRPAILADIPAVLPMVESISSLHRKWDVDRFGIRQDVQQMYARWLPERIVDATSVFLVAERSGAGHEETRLAGYVVGTLEEEIPIYWLPACGYIHDVWVDDAYRHEGVGKQLVMEAVARFKEIGVTQVRLETAAINETGRGLFTSCGFRPATVEMMIVL